MAKKSRDPDTIAAGARLRATRLALGVETVRRFAELTRVHENKLSKYENGAAMVPPSYVTKLNDAYGVTHDWIYGAIRRGLPHELVLKLMEGPRRPGAG